MLRVIKATSLRLGTAAYNVHQVVRGALQPTTLGVRGIIVAPEGKVMLVRHVLYEGWHLPGGRVEAGETVKQSLVREVREESRVIVAPSHLTFHGIFLNVSRNICDQVVVFTIEEYLLDPAASLDREIAEAKLFPMNALPPETTPATRRRIEEHLQHREQSETW